MQLSVSKSCRGTSNSVGMLDWEDEDLWTYLDVVLVDAREIRLQLVLVFFLQTYNRITSVNNIVSPDY